MNHTRAVLCSAPDVLLLHAMEQGFSLIAQWVASSVISWSQPFEKFHFVGETDSGKLLAKAIRISIFDFNPSTIMCILMAN
ncbi:hypothetical protein MUU48_01640 [Scandinavium sp. H11S7]|uniref:hypothetical protein n=1 Tax=Scandinavium hiltneri TaxID=2926519 RepID=UPI0021652593|nr:hypothetical protein [Scandinavium hiltneri]MCS2155663.1 hypothetical protein [Scandinavium hiltneri]